MNLARTHCSGGGILTLKAVRRFLISNRNLDTIHRTDAVPWKMALNKDRPAIWVCVRKERVHFRRHHDWMWS